MTNKEFEEKWRKYLCVAGCAYDEIPKRCEDVDRGIAKEWFEAGQSAERKKIEKAIERIDK